MANCIIVMTTPRDFHWTYKLLNSAAKTYENIALVFDSPVIAKLFKHPYPYKTIITKPQVKHLYSPNYIDNKKVDAIKQIYMDYEYIALIDTETLFLRECTSRLGEIWDNNCMVVNYAIDGGPRTKKIARLCGYTLEEDFYVWFNEVPVYKTSLVPGFLDWHDRNFKISLHRDSFDYVLFSIYCKYELGMSWRVLGDESVKPPNGLNEDIIWRNYPELIRQVNWSTWFPGVENYENIKLLFHLDRFQRP